MVKANNYTAFVLQATGKQFAIYTTPAIGDQLQKVSTAEDSDRPTSHDLMQSIFLGLGVSLLKVVISDLDDTIYKSRIFLEQVGPEETQILEIDARPSDSLLLAIQHQAPVFITQDVIDKSPEYL